MEMWIEPEVVQALTHIGCQRGMSVNALVKLAVKEFLCSMEDDTQCSCATVCEAQLTASARPAPL